MEILKAIIFGLVEGVTEWLPISSTGHLILLNEWLRFDLPADREAAFMEFYDVVIQLAAVMAVVIMYWKVLWPIGREGKDDGKVVVKKKTLTLWLKIIIACIPGLIYGLLLDDMVEDLTAPYKTIIVAVMLILIGILFIIIENAHKDKRPKIKTMPDLDWRIALAIGFFQLIAAALPGSSRSGVTILAGLMMGLSRNVAASFTFFLAIPTMFGASLLKLIKYLKNGLAFSGGEIAILVVSCITAFVISLFAINFLTLYIGKNKDFKPFGVYRIVLGAIVLAYFGISGGLLAG